MSAEQDFLAYLGIVAGVGNPTSPLADNPDTPYPVGTVSFLSITTVIPWMWLGYLTFRFRRVLIQYVRDRFEYMLSDRTDLDFQFEYRMVVGNEYHSVVTMLSNVPRPLEIELTEPFTPRGSVVAEEELSEVIVD